MTKRNDTLYKSPGLAKRCFRTPGQLHLHVDARGGLELLRSLVPALESTGVKVKLNRVVQTVTGPQWEDNKSIFEIHSSSGAGDEYFLSVALESRPQCVSIVKDLLSAVQHVPGAVVEVERVVGRRSRDDGWTDDSYGVVPPISGEDLLFRAEDRTQPIELHHCFEVHGTKAPLDLARLRDDLTKRGLSVGAWAQFERGPQLWSYRSTDFAQSYEFEDRCKSDYNILSDYLADLGIRASELWVIAEEILGIWKAPFIQVQEPSWKNRVAISALIGTDDEAVPNFSDIIRQCRTYPTHGDCEQTPEDTVRAEQHVTRFYEITRHLGVTPVLFELAVTTERASLTQKDFASVIVSYSDCPDDPFLIRAWQESIDDIIRSDSEQICPIIFHPETYQSGYLFERFDWIVEHAYQNLLPSGRRVQSVLECLRRDLRGVGWERIDESSEAEEGIHHKSAACKEYPSRPVSNPAPVRYTLTRLCSALIAQLTKRLKSNTTAPARAAILEMLLKLAESWIVVVPFRWRVRINKNNNNRIDRPGGCIFAVIAPKRGSPQVTLELLNGLAVRFGWMLFRATLEDVYTEDSQAGRRRKTWTDKESRQAREFGERLRKALNGLDELCDNAGERVVRLQQLMPELTQEDEPYLKKLLGFPYEREKAWAKVMQWRFRLARSSMYREWAKKPSSPQHG